MSATIQDDRSPAQRATHRYLVVATDRFMSGWGGAQGGSSIAAWACDTLEALDKVEAWARSRGDMSRVRIAIESGRRYRPPRGCAHLHIYAVTDGHAALK